MTDTTQHENQNTTEKIPVYDVENPDYADLSMAALAKIFEHYGILVTQKIEISDKSQKPRILVRGDEVTGLRAANLAIQNGYPLCLLECLYDVRGTPEKPATHVNLASRRWQLTFKVRR